MIENLYEEKKMKKQYYIIILIVLIITIIGIMLFNSQEKNENVIGNISNINEIENVLNSDGNNIIQNINTQPVVSEDINEIKSMQSQINSNADPNIYRIEREYDGRRILQIKPEVQFNVDLAGIVNNGMPAENEINELVSKVPNKSGIWISEQSRQEFLKLLENNNINNIYISNDGYLQSNGNTENEITTKLNNMINSNKLFIINMTGIAYERDYISGKITEYPFEDMDPYQIIQPYQVENKIILEVTSNNNEKLTDKEILETILLYE